jgi:hypothetical protein
MLSLSFEQITNHQSTDEMMQEHRSLNQASQRMEKRTYSWTSQQVFLILP